MPRPKGNDIAEIFGYAPDDLTPEARGLWQQCTCPFVNGPCIKHNHENTICYGTCSVLNGSKAESGSVIICPRRLYADNYGTIRSVAADAFWADVPFYTYSEYIANRKMVRRCVVALGQNSGREVKLGRNLSMDWVLALINNATLEEYVGLEVQSMDSTGNYRDNWNAYKNLPQNPSATIPRSEHGINWANVHKRLIPQLIRKGIVYANSSFVKKGVYFVIPDVVYKKFEDIIGDIPYEGQASSNSITVFTYELGPQVPHGQQRSLVLVRSIRFLLSEFAERFIAGSNLPTGEALDKQVKLILGLF